MVIADMLSLRCQWASGEVAWWTFGNTGLELRQRFGSEWHRRGR